MRYTVILALLLTLLSAPIVHAQQAPVTAVGERPVPRLVEMTDTGTRGDLVAVHAAAYQPAETTAAAAALRDTSARSVLAVIGGVVVIVALIALLR
jgi:hypothetical protein